MNNESKSHLEDLERIRNFRLMDDDFMKVCFEDNVEATELVLRIILNKPDLRVTKVISQKLMKNLLGRDIQLDIDATDSENKEYDIEIQRDDYGADPKRARYHSSILDAHLLKSGQNFKDLPETYVIFITEHDVFGEGEPIYVINRTIEGSSRQFNDGEHIIYVNGEATNQETELGRLMHDFACTSADDMYYEELAERVRYYKEDEKGVESMCKAIEEMRNEVAREVALKVERETTYRVRYENATSMLKNTDLTVEQVASCSNLPIAEVLALAESLS